MIQHWLDIRQLIQRDPNLTPSNVGQWHTDQMADSATPARMNRLALENLVTNHEFEPTFGLILVVRLPKRLLSWLSANGATSNSGSACGKSWQSGGRTTDEPVPFGVCQFGCNLHSAKHVQEELDTAIICYPRPFTRNQH